MKKIKKSQEEIKDIKNWFKENLVVCKKLTENKVKTTKKKPFKKTQKKQTNTNNNRQTESGLEASKRFGYYLWEYRATLCRITQKV